MGDADWLRESGLNWGWGDSYPDFKQGGSTQDRWKSRGAGRDLLTDKSVVLLAKELVSISGRIKKLKEREARLRGELRRVMPVNGWVKVEDDISRDEYIVEHLKALRKPQLNTRQALRFIRKKFGEDAAAVVAEECSSKSRNNASIYVRCFPVGSDEPDQRSEESSFEDDIPF